MVIHAKYSASFTLFHSYIDSDSKETVYGCEHLQGGDQGKLCVFLMSTFEHKNF